MVHLLSSSSPSLLFRIGSIATLFRGNYIPRESTLVGMSTVSLRPKAQACILYYHLPPCERTEEVNTVLKYQQRHLVRCWLSGHESPHTSAPSLSPFWVLWISDRCLRAKKILYIFLFTFRDFGSTMPI